jgi:hypothetical protein
MNLIVLIGDMEAIPIRAIPFITGGRITADQVASMFAHTDPWELRRRGLEPYHLSDNGHCSPMLPKEWDGIEVELRVLRAKLQARQEVEMENYPVWRRESILLLPPACFVNKGHFETTFRHAYSVLFYDIIDERPGDRELNFWPYVPRDLEETIMEGFPKSQRAVVWQWPWGGYETPLLRIIAGAVNRWCVSEDEEYPQKKTEKVQDWIKAEMEKVGIPVSDSLVDHIETIISPREYSHTRQRVKRKD